MNSHLRDTFANRFAITKITERRTAKTRQAFGPSLLIGEVRKPRIEIG
jgi:hypothetical protein